MVPFSTFARILGSSDVAVVGVEVQAAESNRAATMR
jgi:hypothetical protein